VSRTIRRVDDGVSEVAGDLSLNGTTANLTWRVTSVEADRQHQVIRAHAETSLSRSSFGITKLTWLVGDLIHADAVVVARAVPPHGRRPA
jgi:polyisoprenoid-binding protein YceI